MANTNASRSAIILVSMLLLTAIVGVVLSCSVPFSGIAVAQAVPTDTPIAGGGGGGTTNNYYGINCGDVATPCHIVVDSIVSITATDSIPITSGLTLPVTFTMPIAISASLPISTYTYPGPITDNSNSVYLVALFSFLLGKLMLLLIWNIPEDNVFKRLEYLGVTSLFMLVDILVLYPAYSAGMSLGVGGVWFVFWLAVTFIRDIVHFLTHLGKR